eukprot:CAMPEP_0196994348 /NCGR_PEP_ID=MMETSP1380-20130617/649_1 /TAXON_ID=5936 /ORGANISM="Euplotes crassus, Strain CT5" /LENGTH=125 /DNA_ID=CAMNT_0042409689 /DNA_START=287 /DNA_END=664 /DNA_ORIENTATION=+
MTLVFYLFILSPENLSFVKTTTFIVGAVQAGLSIYLIISENKKYRHPDDPDSIEGLWALLMLGLYALEFLVFVVMIGNFLVILFNSNEPEQKRSDTQNTIYYYAPQDASQSPLKVQLVAAHEIQG